MGDSSRQLRAIFPRPDPNAPTAPTSPLSAAPKVALPLSKPKRQQTGVACESCRRRKCKCDGKRPVCSPCERRREDCLYEADNGLTRTQTLKRKAEALTETNQGLKAVVTTLRSGSDVEAVEILRRIRQTEDVDTAVDFIAQASLLMPQNRPRRSSSTPPIAQLLHDLTSSKGLHHLSIDTAFHALESLPTGPTSGEKVPSLYRMQPWMVEPGVAPSTTSQQAGFTYRLNELMDGLNFLDGVPGSAAVEDSKAADHPTVYLPYICVSAAPWTNITNDDEFVSHAISLFLTWDHPWYNCIERSSFLGAMGEARLLDSKVMPESEFCSPSLVNAIIALGCLHSRHPTAFETSGNAKTRGRHFLKLADELLEHEILHRKPKIATLSSMFLNLTAHGIHGEPVFGTEKFEEFYRIYDDLRLGDPHTLPPDYYINRDVRARFDAISEITWGLYCQDVSHSITGGHPPRLNRPQIAQTFAFKANGKSSHYDDSTMEADGCIMYDPNDTWWPYPHPGIPEPSRVKECLKAKCDLSNLVQDMWDCIDSPESPAWLKHDSGEPGKVQRAMDIFDKLKLWKTKLPEPLAPGGSTLPHVMLLRGYYDTVVINLFRSMQEARVLLDGTYSTLHHEIEHPRTYVFTHCISLAATTAEFRNRYTLFRHWLTMQFAWAVAWTLLFHLDAAFGEPTTDAFVDAVRALRELAQKFELAAQVVVTLRKMAEDYEVELPPRAVRWLYPVDRLRQRQRQLQLQHQHQRQGAGGDRRRRATATSADAAELADALALLDEVKMDDPDQVLSDIRIPVTIPKRYRTDGHKHLKGRGTFGPEIADVMTNLRAMHIADDD